MRVIAGTLGSIEVETAQKVASLLAPLDGMMEALHALCRERLDASGTAIVRGTLAFASGLTVNAAHSVPMSVYLSHPMRVASLILRVAGTVDAKTLVIALLHNIYEVGTLDEARVEAAGYSSTVAQAIRLLTIDRRLERDRRYLRTFYDRIEAAGAELMLIRCLDKLDNLLGLELCEEGEDRSSYIELAEEFVTPMATRLSPWLGQYVGDVMTFMRHRGYRPELKAQYDQWVRRQAEPVR